ncbi:ankyrin repeat-containing domain protein [Aspergillus heterothallicus]
MADILLEHGADVMALADARALMNDWTRGEDMHEWNYYVGEDDPPLEDVYPLHCAAINWNINIAAKLLAAGADIHSRTSIKGSTALHLAATRFMLEMIQFLIKSGVDYSLADCGGRTMVHHLAFVRRHEMDRVRKFLVELGIYDASMEEEFGFLRLSPMMTDYYGTNDFGRIGL